MTDSDTSRSGTEAGSPVAQETGTVPRTLAPAAERALAEAAARRAARDAETAASGAPPREEGGRAGPDPVRYGDWETGGIASDF